MLVVVLDVIGLVVAMVHFGDLGKAILYLSIISLCECICLYLCLGLASSNGSYDLNCAR